MPKYFRVCPICGSSLNLKNADLYCPNCEETFTYDSRYKVWRNPKIMDIAYTDPHSGILSNLFPHKFSLQTAHGIKTFNSMEAFFLTLCWPGTSIGIYDELASLSGMDAVKARSVLPDWRNTGKVNWNGTTVDRRSIEYKQILVTAFDELFKQSHLFRLGLMKSRGKKLMYVSGDTDMSKVLLTQKEFISLLERERRKIEV